ncbi:MAG: hypothetical protein ACK5PB_16345 [Pirellula sp.]|jgi:hypothetical protein
MTGLLSILLSMLLPQAEVLPGLSSSAPAAIVPDVSATQPTSGWEVDQRSQKFTFIIQVPPNAVNAFAQGPTGNELPVNVEDRLVGKIEQIAIRFDTKELPRIDPPNTNSRSQANINPSIQNLALMRYAPQTLAGTNRWEDTVGWQFDNRTNRFAYVIQIPVASLNQFLTGPTGQELIVPIHPDARDFVEQITVRIGNGALPKDPVPPSVREKYPSSQGDNIRNLAGGNNYGAPVSIDPTPISGAGDLGLSRGGQSAVLPDLPGNSGSFANGSDSGLGRLPAGSGLTGNNMTNNNTPNYPSLNNMGSPNYTSTNNNPITPQNYRTPSTSETPSLDAARQANARDLMPDPRNRMTGSLFGQADSMRNNPVYNRYANNSDVRNGGTTQEQLNSQYNQGYIAPQNQYANTANPAYSQIASNPTQSFPPQGFSNVPTSAIAGNLPSNPISPVSFTGGNGQQGQLAGNQIQQGVQPVADKKIGFNWALAALVLLGFNIYQFFWMSNARIKYRQMVMSKRSTRLEPTA